MMDYVCPIWRHAVPSHIEKPQVIESQCLHIVIAVPWYISNLQIHEDLKVSYLAEHIRSTNIWFQASWCRESSSSVTERLKPTQGMSNDSFITFFKNLWRPSAETRFPQSWRASAEVINNIWVQLQRLIEAIWWPWTKFLPELFRSGFSMIFPGCKTNTGSVPKGPWSELAIAIGNARLRPSGYFSKCIAQNPQL